ncbi:MAG: D-galactonate dehydratase family protein [Chloroherpetonaceae bacterium]|nr:D-galactonate dehydratase family protein [Chthonomonadaceae bacterium]MDW8208231.1 D-galactonate dehydratase family protein [Chloroherpetonaceae bacterium]
MKITEVRTIVTCPGRNYVIVKIVTDEPGLYGVGDATLNGRELAVATILQEYFAPLLIGRDPDRIEDIWQTLYRGFYWKGGPDAMTALSGIDMALWDIKGKRAGMPVYALLGGKTREGVLAYTHAGGRDFVEVEDAVRQCVEQGFKVVRAQVAVPGGAGTYGAGGRMEAASATWIHGDGGPMPAIERWEPSPYLRVVPNLFAHLRATVGPEVELLHDVHERLTPIQAARLARELEPFHLFFLEDPLRPENREGFRIIRQHSTTPLAMGELFHTRYECLPLLTEQLIDFIRCDLGHSGGITEARKIAAVAECYQVQTAWHGPGDIAPPTHAANVHLDLALPNFGVQEMVFFPEIVQEVLPGAPVFRDGYLEVADMPGLGVDVNEDLAAKYPYQRAYLPMVRRADGSVHDW